MEEKERGASAMAMKGGLTSALQFRPWPIWDPVPWLIDILDRRQLIEIARIQLQFHREVLTAQMQAAEAMEKVLGR